MTSERRHALLSLIGQYAERCCAYGMDEDKVRLAIAKARAIFTQIQTMLNEEVKK